MLPQNDNVISSSHGVSPTTTHTIFRFVSVAAVARAWWRPPVVCRDVHLYILMHLRRF